jgi:cell division protein FtsW (lipid II flippase)
LPGTEAEEEAPTSTTRQQNITSFSGAVAGEEEDFSEGSFHTHILYFVLSFALLYFYWHLFIKNPKKLESLIVVFTCLLLVLLE